LEVSFSDALKNFVRRIGGTVCERSVASQHDVQLDRRHFFFNSSNVLNNKNTLNILRCLISNSIQTHFQLKLPI
jgi:hypothetical protein